VIRLTYVNHYSVVSSNRRKVLLAQKVKTPEPKGKWASIGASPFPIADIDPPAYGWNLSHSLRYLCGTWKPRIVLLGTNRGKGCLEEFCTSLHPSIPFLEESEPQGEPMAVRVWDVGKSEGQAVMVWIGVQTLPYSKGELTSDGCWMTRKLKQLVTGCSVD